MGSTEIEKKLCKIFFISTIFVFIIAFNNNRIHALSVDYSRHHCNHEHPKAHEASGILKAFKISEMEFSGFFMKLKFKSHIRPISRRWIMRRETMQEAILTKVCCVLIMTQYGLMISS